MLENYFLRAEGLGFLVLGGWGSRAQGSSFRVGV